MDSGNEKLVALLSRYIQKSKSFTENNNSTQYSKINQKIFSIHNINEEKKNLINKIEISIWNGNLPSCKSSELCNELSNLLKWWEDESVLVQSDLNMAIESISLCCILIMISKNDIWLALSTSRMCNCLLRYLDPLAFDSILKCIETLNRGQNVSKEDLSYLEEFLKPRIKVSVSTRAWEILESFLIRSRMYNLLFIIQERFKVISLKLF